MLAGSGSARPLNLGIWEAAASCRSPLASFARRSGMLCAHTSGRGPSVGASAALLWYTRDLRIGDHDGLSAACAQGRFDHLLPVYCLDPRQLHPRRPAGTGLGVPQLGPHRCRLLLDALHSLHHDLSALGSSLAFRQGSPEEELPRLLHPLARMGMRRVALLHHQDSAPGAAALEAAVARAFQAEAAQQGMEAEVRSFWCAMLYHPDDLPYSVFRDGAARKGQGAAGNAQQRDSGPMQGAAPSLQPELPASADQQRFLHIPQTMTDFRKAVTAHSSVRPAVPAPCRLPPLPWAPLELPCAGVEASGVSEEQQAQQQPAQESAAQRDRLLGSIPVDVRDLYAQAGAVGALQELQRLTGCELQPRQLLTACHGGRADARSAFPFVLGEASGLRRLRQYLVGHAEAAGQGTAAEAAPALQHFVNTRMQAAGVDNSTKLSAWLNLGCLSPRQVHWEVQALHQLQQQQQQEQQEANAQEGAQGSSRATATEGGDAAWLVMHLCIRDFFTYTALKAGNALLEEGGIQGAPVEWRSDRRLLQAWASGRTGLPFVDANMRELAGSGWMSNRGRQNVACLFAKDLMLDWRLGAELFESLLLDADPAVNAANWNYFAGIGNDPRNRHFKTVTQGEQYDRDAVLAAAWLPELAYLPTAALRHRPWEVSKEAAAVAGFVRGADYPEPVVDPSYQIGMGPQTAHQRVVRGQQRQRRQAAQLQNF